MDGGELSADLELAEGTEPGKHRVSLKKKTKKQTNKQTNKPIKIFITGFLS